MVSNTAVWTCLSVCLSVCLLGVLTWLSVCLNLSVSLVRWPVCLSVFLSVCLPVWTCLSHRCVGSCVDLSVYLSICLFVWTCWSHRCVGSCVNLSVCLNLSLFSQVYWSRGGLGTSARRRRVFHACFLDWGLTCWCYRSGFESRSSETTSCVEVYTCLSSWLPVCLSVCVCVWRH